MRRRCWSCAAAVEIGPGNGPVGPPVLLDRPKMELKVWVVKEPRRFWGPVGGVFSLLADMVRAKAALMGNIKGVVTARSCSSAEAGAAVVGGRREILEIALSCSLQLREESRELSRRWMISLVRRAACASSADGVQRTARWMSATEAAAEGCARAKFVEDQGG
jgi:hypothetical protein